MSEPNFIPYNEGNQGPRLLVRLEDETVWLTQAQMVELFQTTKQNISLHIANVFEERELPPEATVKEYLTVHPLLGSQPHLVVKKYLTTESVDPPVDQAGGQR